MEHDRQLGALSPIYGPERPQSAMGVALLEGQRGSGGTPVTGVTLVASEEARSWLKVASIRVDRTKATFSHL